MPPQEYPEIRESIRLWKSQNTISESLNFDIPLEIIDYIASIFSPGSFYYFIWNFKKFDIDYVHSSIENVLGWKPGDLNGASIASFYHPDDLKRMNSIQSAASDFLFNKIEVDDVPHYKLVYTIRFKHRDGTYRRILHQSIPLNTLPDGRIFHFLIIHTDITYLKGSMSYDLSFFGRNGRPSFMNINPENPMYELCEAKSQFTPRELELIRLISQGKSQNEIAEFLSISPFTVKKHKQNIFAKIGCKSSAQLVAYCLSQGLIH